MFLLTVMTASTILSLDKQAIQGSLPPLALITDLVCNRVIEQNFLFSQKVLESIRMLYSEGVAYIKFCPKKRKGQF